LYSSTIVKYSLGQKKKKPAGTAGNSKLENSGGSRKLKQKRALKTFLFQLELGQNGGNWPSLNLGEKKCFPRTGGRGKEN